MLNAIREQTSAELRTSADLRAGTGQAHAVPWPRGSRVGTWRERAGA